MIASISRFPLPTGVSAEAVKKDFLEVAGRSTTPLDRAFPSTLERRLLVSA